MTAPDNQQTEMLRRVWIATGTVAICAILAAMAIADTRPAWATPQLLLWGTSIPLALFMCTHLAVLRQRWFTSSRGTSWWRRAKRGYARTVWVLILLGSIAIFGGIWYRLLPWRD